MPRIGLALIVVLLTLAVTSHSKATQPAFPPALDDRATVANPPAPTPTGVPSALDWEMVRIASIVASVAVGLAVILILVFAERGALSHRMGSATWSFSDSWSTTLTIGGAMVTSLVGFSGVPDQGHVFGAKTYTFLSLLFAGLVGLAPGVYSLFRQPVQTTSGGQTAIQYQGFVVMFLAAAAFTVAGVWAQLSLLRAVVEDVAMAGVVSMKLAQAFDVLFHTLQWVLWCDAVVTIVQAVRLQSAPKRIVAVGQPMRLVRPGQAAAAFPGAPEEQLPDWPLL